MNKDEMHELLHTRLAVFRSWSYASLAERVETDDRSGDCLEHIDGVGSDGTQYQIEFNAFWDGKPHGDIRVEGALSAEPQRRLLGFLPIFMPHLSDGFIMRPDGSFVDEDSNNKANKAEMATPRKPSD